MRSASIVLMTVLCTAVFTGGGWILGQFTSGTEPFTAFSDTLANRYAIFGALLGGVVGPMVGARVKRK